MSADGAWVYCMRESSDLAGKDDKGWIHRLVEPPAPRIGVLAKGKSKGKSSVTKYAVADVAGNLVAVHGRRDFADGSKQVWWEMPDGSTGLVGRKPEDLPLYGIEDLTDVLDDWTVVVVEGEKAREALAGIDVRSVGTVTGADTTPSLEVLRPLARCDVVLWADNDDKGRRHMRAIASRLGSIGRTARLLTWPEAPEKGDAADFVAAGLGRDELNIMCQNAPKWGENGLSPDSNVDMNIYGNLEHLRGNLISNGQVPDEHLRSPFLGDEHLRAAPKMPGLIVIDTVVSRQVHWLWRGRIPLGKTTVIDGDPGLGKTMWLMDLAARVSRARAMPDGTPSDLDRPRGVVILNAEDALDDTLRPRLEAAGADLTKIAALKFVLDEDGESFPEILKHLPWIERAIVQMDAALVIIDPLMGFLGSAKEINANADQDMRRVLNPFGQLMEKYGCAGAPVRHLRKQEGGNSLYRGSGSIAIVGAARSGLLVARDPDDPAKRRRVLTVQKTNLSEEMPSLVYHIEANEAGIPFVVWDGTSHHTASSLLSEPDSPEERSKLEEAIDFLESELQDGMVLAETVAVSSRKYGISSETLRRARLSMGVTRENGTVMRQGYNGKWAWKLPEKYVWRLVEVRRFQGSTVDVQGPKKAVVDVHLPSEDLISKSAVDSQETRRWSSLHSSQGDDSEKPDFEIEGDVAVFE